MKKIIFSLVIMIILSTSSFVVAATNNGSAGATLELTGLNIAASPGVFMYYAHENNQWFVIGTVHQGGTTFNGTAQNSTSLFTQTAVGPKDLEDLTGLTWPTGTADTASEEWWSTSGWTRK